LIIRIQFKACSLVGPTDHEEPDGQEKVYHIFYNRKYIVKDIA